MGGCLILMPLVPIQFTSLITAIVWTFSGPSYAIVFVTAGTFLQADSYTVFFGIQNIVTSLFPNYPLGVHQLITTGVMFGGNLTTAYLFKLVLHRRLLRRFSSSVFPGTTTTVTIDPVNHPSSSPPSLGTLRRALREV